MKTAFYNDIWNAIKTLHYRHGKGDIKELYQFFDGRITITAQCFNCKPHTVKASYDGKTLKMYRHQMKVTVV